MRELLGIARKRSPDRPVVEQWIGISVDEAQRMKPAREKNGDPATWVTNRWPLIDLRMSRNDCLRWLEKHGYPRAPRSACTFCPFHSDEEWRGLTPEEFADAVKVDETIRGLDIERKGEPLFLHRSRVPLAEVDFTVPRSNQLSLFGNECEGMCGV
jgi:hypothetical protein